MKHFLILLLTSIFIFLVSCENNNFKNFDSKQQKIKKGMSFRQVSKVLGKPEFINNQDSQYIAKYNYGNPDGYRFSIGFSKDSLVMWKEYEN
jgi:hypothetical protein